MERARVAAGGAAAQERRALIPIAARRLVGIGLVALACRAAPPPADPEPNVAPDPGPHAVATPPRPSCGQRPPSVEAAQAFDEGRALLDVARDGEHFDPQRLEAALDRLKIAALGGHIGAQSLFGTTVFGMLITRDAPQPEDRGLWITAIKWLRTAALAGDPDALAFVPGLTSAMPPSREEMPFSEIPAEWLIEAWRRADAYIACYGMPWRVPPSA